MSNQMVEEFKQQIQYFNKVITLFIIILVIMSVIIASLIFLKLQEIKTVDSLDKIIRGTLEEYKPDRAAQIQARETINDTNVDVEEILNMVKNSSVLH